MLTGESVFLRTKTLCRSTEEDTMSVIDSAARIQPHYLVDKICTTLHITAGVPLIGEIINDVLSQPTSRALNNALQPGGLESLPTSEDPTKSPIVQRATDSILGLPKVRPPPPPPIIPKLPRPRPLTPLEINRGFGRALSLITILGQVDSYIAERARAIVRKLLLLVDDDSVNRIQQNDY